MNDEHVYVDEKGIKWNRVWNIPQANIDSDTDPFSNQSFKDKTANQKGSYGDIMDQSKEMSQKEKTNSVMTLFNKNIFKEYSKKKWHKAPS